MKEFYLNNPGINKFFGFVGAYKVLGFIPLDMIAHFTVTVILTLIILKITKKYLWVFTIIILIGLLKEYYDSFALSANLHEHIKDMIVNITYPTISFLILKIKSRSKSKTQYPSNSKN